MKVETASFAHQGGRDEQQDAHGVFASGEEHLVVVADGMGGHAGGRLASAQVIETARRIWEAHRAKPLEPRRLLERIIREGHAAINEAGTAAGVVPRSTAAVLYVGRARAHWAHVGDSRIYRFRDGEFRERTRDHSVVQMLVDLGKVAEEEMGTHPDQNRLTQSLGGDSPPSPDFGVEDLKPGDSFLLCSDGFWEVIPSKEMLKALASPSMGNGVAEELAQRAFHRAGPRSDNITVAMVRVDGAAAVRPMMARGSQDEAAWRPAGSQGRIWAVAMIVVLVLGGAAAVLRPWATPQPLPAVPSAMPPAPEPLPTAIPRSEPSPSPQPEPPTQSLGPAPPAPEPAPKPEPPTQSLGPAPPAPEHAPAPGPGSAPSADPEPPTAPPQSRTPNPVPERNAGRPDQPSDDSKPSGSSPGPADRLPPTQQQ